MGPGSSDNVVTNLTLAIARVQNRRNMPFRFRVLLAVKTVRNKFLSGLCLFDPSVPNVLDHL